jgi:hypothetical protein
MIGNAKLVILMNVLSTLWVLGVFYFLYGKFAKEMQDPLKEIERLKPRDDK